MTRQTEKYVKSVAMRVAESPVMIGRGAARAGIVAVGLLLALAGCDKLGLPWGSESATPLGAPAPIEGGIPYEVTIEGDLEDDLSALLDQSSRMLSLIDSPPSSLVGLNRRAEGDVERFQTALRSEGFYNAQVTFKIDSNASPIQTVLSVDPGILYLLADYDIHWVGSPAPPADHQPSIDDLGLYIGMTARGPAIVGAQEDLLRRLSRHGYPLARVASREAMVDHDTTTMTVRLDLDAGAAARFGGVIFHGLDTVQEDYARALLTWGEGDEYDSREVESSRRALSGTKLFASIDIEPAESVGPDGTLPIEIAVIEADQRSIGVGANYSTAEGIGGEVFWEHRNFFGRNEHLRVGLTAAEIEQVFSARLRKPLFLRSDQEFLANTEIAHRDTNAFEEYSISGTAGVERSFGEYWSVLLGGTGEFSDITDDQGQTTFLLFGIPMAAIYDSSDNLLNPTDGARMRASVTPYGGSGDEPLNFAEGTIVGSLYRAIDSDRRFIFAVRGLVGSLVGEETAVIPANMRFYAGGGGSIRGYEFQSVGPLDGDDSPLGGRSVLEVNTELRIRVTETIGVVPFIDGGTAFDNSTPDFEEDVLWAVGLGGRYFSAVGPLRIDFAVPMNKREFDDDFQFYISLGQAF
jgi:translocation and assembly module TamA